MKKRKARGDSKLDNLKPESRVLELRDLLLGGATYKKARIWLLETCRETTNAEAMTRFWQRHCQPIKDEEMSLTAAAAEGYIDRMGKTDWDSAMRELMKQTTFEILSGQAVDPKVAGVYVKNMLKIRDQDDAASRAAEAARTKEEAGVDALMESAKGNKKAMALLKQFQEAIAK